MLAACALSLILELVCWIQITTDFKGLQSTSIIDLIAGLIASCDIYYRLLVYFMLNGGPSAASDDIYSTNVAAYTCFLSKGIFKVIFYSRNIFEALFLVRRNLDK
jgi:hypothetical protein